MRKKEMLLEFRKDEKDENVLRWIDEYVTELDRDIEKEIIIEERERIGSPT